MWPRLRRGNIDRPCCEARILAISLLSLRIRGRFHLAMQHEPRAAQLELAPGLRHSSNRVASKEAVAMGEPHYGRTEGFETSDRRADRSRLDAACIGHRRGAARWQQRSVLWSRCHQHQQHGEGAWRERSRRSDSARTDPLAVLEALGRVIEPRVLITSG